MGFFRLSDLFALFLFIGSYYVQVAARHLKVLEVPTQNDDTEMLLSVFLPTVELTLGRSRKPFFSRCGLLLLLLEIVVGLVLLMRLSLGLHQELCLKPSFFSCRPEIEAKSGSEILIFMRK